MSHILISFPIPRYFFYEKTNMKFLSPTFAKEVSIRICKILPLYYFNNAYTKATFPALFFIKRKTPTTQLLGNRAFSVIQPNN